MVGEAGSSGAARAPCDECIRPRRDRGRENVGDNRRILLIDDSPAIHEDFHKILAPRAPARGLEDAEAALFGDARRDDAGFALDSAFQGQEGLRRVEAALAEGRPYALAFVDMRMPPGWDGMETVERLWQADPRLQVVICTAYSDHAWEEVLDRVAVQDRLLILKKPFDLIEVSQLARTLTAKWSLARRSETQQAELASTVADLRAADQALRCAIRDLEIFAFSVAHDLEGPLARIRSFASLLAEHLPEGGGKPSHYLGRVIANAAAGEQLVRGLVDLAEVAHAPLQPEAVDVGAMVQRLFEPLRASDPDRDARLEVADGLVAWADPRLLQVALLHLVENSWKFTSRCASTQLVLGLAERTAGEAVFYLRDNGCGFDPAEAGRLFHNCVRLHGGDDYPGTGLGLVTVSRILQRHGGRVWADSAPDQGTTFHFSLPLRPGRAADNG